MHLFFKQFTEAVSKYLEAVSNHHHMISWCFLSSSVLENKTERARHHKLFTSFGGQARKESAVLFYEVLVCSTCILRFYSCLWKVWWLLKKNEKFGNYFSYGKLLSSISLQKSKLCFLVLLLFFFWLEYKYINLQCKATGNLCQSLWCFLETIFHSGRRSRSFQ